MKKIYFITRIVTFAIFILLSANVSVFAQIDGFVNYDLYDTDEERGDVQAPALPYRHGLGDNTQSNVPVGSGVVVLSLMGAAYMLRKNSGKKRRNKKILFLFFVLILSVNTSLRAQDYYFDKPVESSDATNMTVYGQLKIDGEFQVDNIEIAAFCDDEVRGRTILKKLTGNQYLFFLTIYGSIGDVMELKFYDHELKTELHVFGDYSISFDPENITGANAGTLEYFSIIYRFIGLDADWNTISNWQLVCSAWTEPQSATQLPSSNPKMIDDIIVAENLDASANYIVKNVEIENEKILTITSQGALEIIGDIVNADENAIVVDADNENVGSLLHNDDNVKATVKVNLDNSSVSKNWDADWHFISSPVTEQTIASFIPATENHDFYSWSEFNSTWYNECVDNHSVSNEFYTDNGNNFNVGRGYLVAYENADVKEFSGVMNNGDVIFPLSCSAGGEYVVEKYAGFNLLGNPYPSYIDWEAEGWTIDNLQLETIWIYDDDVNNYITYTKGGVSTNDGSQYIAPCQGFFVKAASVGDLVMTNDVRTSAKSSFRKDVDDNVLKIKVEGATGKDEIAVVKNEGNDVFKMFSIEEAAPSLYVNEDNGDYTVVYIDDEKSLPLCFETARFAKYTISLGEAGNDFKEVILEDRLSGEKVNLQTESYTFLHSENAAKDRFVLTIALGDDNDNDKFAYTNNGKLIVGGISGDATINVFDVIGRVMFSTKETASCVSTTDGKIGIPMNAANAGIYVIQKIDDKGVKTQKIYFE